MINYYCDTCSYYTGTGGCTRPNREGCIYNDPWTLIWDAKDLQAPRSDVGDTKWIQTNIDTAIKDIPSRICLVCDKLEHPDSSIADIGKVWICDECKKTLREIIKKRNEKNDY